MKRATLLATIFLASAFSTLAQNPVVQNIIDDLEMDSILEYANEITGEVSVMINGNSETITSRHKNNPGNDLTVDYLEQKLTSFGLTPQRQSFSATGENIYVELPGALYPNQKYVLCAHFDAIPGSGPAPAADDDGSGTAALIEAARILSQYQFEYTIVIGWWDEEEQGLLGSASYAGFAAANDDTLLGVFNVDAIAWDGDADFLARVHTRPIGNSEDLADTVIAVNTAYNIGLNMVINNPGATYSDHSSFWNEGYGAVLIIEDFDNDPNPYYHTPNDLVQYYSIDYFEMLSKLSFASVASCAIPFTGTIGVEERVNNDLGLSSYPNPANEEITLRFKLAASADVRVVITDALGREISSANLGMLSAGAQLYKLHSIVLPQGMYNITVIANEGTNEQYKQSVTTVVAH